MNDNSGAQDRNEELGGGLSGKERGVAEAFGKWWLRGGTSPEEAAAALSLDEGMGGRGAEGQDGRAAEESENRVTDGNRRMPRIEASGTPGVGEGGPGPLREGGRRCVPGREQEGRGGGGGGQGQLRDGKQAAQNTRGRWARPSLSRPQLQGCPPSPA